MLRGLACCLTLVGISVVLVDRADALDPAHLILAASRTMTCEGEFGTGSGLAGSYIGEKCFLRAGTEEEERVQKVCGQRSVCRVEGRAELDKSGRATIDRVISVEQLKVAPSFERSYLEKVSERIDGILAPANAGCENRQDTDQDRVSVLLEGSQPAAVQLFGRYCAVTSGSGDSPNDRGFQANLRAMCGPSGSSDASLRTGKSGEKSEIVLVFAKGENVRINGEPYVRCPIRQAYTPRWWIESSHFFRGKYPK